MGGIHSRACNDLARNIWLWCAHKDIWLSAPHIIPGRLNVLADLESRSTNIDTEWMLKPRLFQQLLEIYFIPDIDLFASRLNHQVETYISWRPDSGAYAIDAFTISWNNFRIYAFPPFSLIGRVIHQVQQDKAEGMLVIPNWRTRHWFPRVMSMLIAQSVLIPSTMGLLQLPHYMTAVHPLYQKMLHLVCHLSGEASKAQAFRTALQVIMSSWRQRTQKQYRTYLLKWKRYCRERNINPISPLISDALDFLTDLFESGLKYSAINTARSAISRVVQFFNGFSFGSHPLTSRFMRGIFIIGHHFSGTRQSGMLVLLYATLMNWSPIQIFR